MSDVDYWYLHEKATIAYTVRISDPPADVSKADFHKNTPAGAVFHREPSLVKQGGGKIPFDVKSQGLTLDDSPIMVEFTFSKSSHPIPRKHIVVLSLAEPAVQAIKATPERDPGEEADLEVIAWDARSFDQPGVATQFEERDPNRITRDARSKVKWQVEGEDIPPKGEKVKTTIKSEWLGKLVTVEGYLGDVPPSQRAAGQRIDAPRESNRLTRSRLRRSTVGAATAQIAVPKLELKGPKKVIVGDGVTITAEVQPSVVRGGYEWKITDPNGRVEKAGTGPKVEISGITVSESEEDVTLECTFTSGLTSNKYTATHKLTVVEPSVQAKALEEASHDGAPFCAVCEQAKREGATGPVGQPVVFRGGFIECEAEEETRRELVAEVPPANPPPPPPADGTAYVELELKDDQGKPVKEERWVLTLPDGATREGKLDQNGFARVEGLPPETVEVKVAFPDRDGPDWLGGPAVAAIYVERPALEPEAGDWLELELKDDTGKPVAEERWVVTQANGTRLEGRLDAQGHARVEGLAQGDAKVSFPDRDRADWLEPDAPKPKPAKVEKPKTFLELELQDDAKEPAKGVRFLVELPDGQTLEGELDDHGKARLEGVPAGVCRVTFPDLDGPDWHPVD